MGKIWELVNIVRSLPALYLYKTLPCAEDIRQDLVRMGYSSGVTGSCWELHQTLLHHPTFRNCFYYRTGQQAPVMTRISKLLYRPDRNFQLDAERIGGGMVVYHGNASIVFAKSIGKNFCVYQQVTVGRGKMIDGNDLPIIGDNVNIYAGAIVVGGVRIGNNVNIGAGAVVVRDVPDNATVVGAPVRVIVKQGDGNE